MKELLLSVRPGETTLAVMDGEKLVDLAVENDGAGIVGRVYKGVIRNVVPALSGMFVDIGLDRNAFLRSRDICTPEPHTEGASVLVQVEKDTTETKGPLVTEHISFAGKYGVALLGENRVGVSKKIKSETKRTALREAVKALLPPRMGAIVRTAAVAVDREAFTRDMESLFRTGDIVEKRYKVAKAPALLYRDADLAVKALRDYMDSSVDHLYVDDMDTWQRLSRMAEEEQVPRPERVELYNQDIPLFHAFHAFGEMEKLFDRVVELPGGGSLVIDYTEALTAIDVNSGSFKGSMPHGELAYLINKEAAVEIARQLRLRGIGGMILIDFIDMDSQGRQEDVVRILREAVRTDHVKTVVLGMTKLGLVEMTRKRTGLRLWQNYFEPCELCHGTGRTPSVRTVACRILDDLALRKAEHSLRGGVVVQCHPEVAALFTRPEWHERLVRVAGSRVQMEKSGQTSRSVYSLLSE